MPTEERSTGSERLKVRMPVGLRARLREYADARHLGEAEALRLIIDDHLTKVDEEREQAEIDRWQFQEAYKTFRDDIAGNVKTVPWEEIERVFTDALARRPARSRR